MKKRLMILLAVAAMVITILAMPLTAYAYVTSGTIDAPRYSNGNMIKYTYINGANVSLYYITGSGGTYYSYPFQTKNQPGSPDTPKGCPVQLWDWSSSSIGDYNSTIYPRIGGNGNDYSNWGPVYTVSGITNSKVKVAVAIVLLEGYDRSTAYQSYGIDWQHAQYATNVCLQNFEALVLGGSDLSGYSPYGGPSVNGGTAQFCYQLGQDARRYLSNSSPQSLAVAPSVQNVTAEGSYYDATVTISLPQTVGGANRSTYYTNSYSLDTSGFPAGTIVSGYTGSLDSNGNQLIQLKIPMAGNAGKTFIGRATGTYISRTANVDLYNVGWSSGQYTRQVAADERVSITNNNIATPTSSFTVTTPSLPDLTVTSLKTDKTNYEAGDTVTVTAVAANIGYSDVPSTTMKLDVSGVGTQSKSVSSLTANGGTQTVTFTFIAPSALTAQTLTLTATIDSNNTIAESNENNNTLTTTCTVGALRPDITITNTTVQNWYAGKDVVVSATVKNLTAQPVPSVTVRFTMGGVVMDTSVPIAGNGSNLAVYRFTVPQAGSYPVSFTADPSGALSETNKSNNIWSGQVTVIDMPVSTVLDPDDAGMEQQYRVYGLKALPSTGNSDYHTWQEMRLESGSYVTKSYWARLTTTFAVSPDSRIAIAGQPDVMESGFGVQAQCITTLTSNYDHPEDLIGPQMVWTLYPESGYGQTVNWQNVRDSMEAASGQAGAWSITWQYAANPYSSIGARLHYTPIWFPDGQYTALAQAYYAWGPTGQLYNYTMDDVTISGDMYDRITTVGR